MKNILIWMRSNAISNTMNVHDCFFMIVYLAFFVISLAIFFIRRRKYISWYRWFDLRMNKFREKYKLWELHPGQAYNTTTSVMFIQ
jgi:hypothetical protein